MRRSARSAVDRVSVGSSISTIARLREARRRLFGQHGVDAVFAPLVAFAVQPRDRSYSGGGFDLRKFAFESGERIMVLARTVLRELEHLLPPALFQSPS